MWELNNLRLKDFDYSNPDMVYFVTICSKHSINNELADRIINSLSKIRQRKGIRIYCYCLMPDHLHLALSPSSDSGTVSTILQGLKSFTTQIAWGYGIKGKLWQRSFYDHIARKDEDLIKICQYILDNPVRKGLVVSANQWKYAGMWDPLPFQGASAPTVG